MKGIEIGDKGSMVEALKLYDKLIVACIETLKLADKVGK